MTRFIIQLTVFCIGYTQVTLDTLNPNNSPVSFTQQSFCFNGGTGTGTGTVRDVFSHLANLGNLRLDSTNTLYSTSLELHNMQYWMGEYTSPIRYFEPC